MTTLRKRMIEDLKIRNYSTRTITVYINRVAKFAQYFGKSPDRLTREHIREYQRYLVEEKKCSWSQLNQTVCALRFLYRVCLDQATLVEYIPYARQPKSLPVVLSRGEVYRLLEAARDLKHRTVLMLLYGTGVRISEALALRVGDVDSQRMVIHVRWGKAAKDRYLPLAESLRSAGTLPQTPRLPILPALPIQPFMLSGSIKTPSPSLKCKYIVIILEYQFTQHRSHEN